MTDYGQRVILGFHSIGFPSEWGECEEAILGGILLVSIQLVSPASGEMNRKTD